MKISIFVLITLLFVAGASVEATAQTSYNPATAFEHGFTTGSNPNNPWSYGYSSGFMGSVALFDDRAHGSPAPNEQLWLSSKVNNENLPSIAYNDGPAFSNGNVNFLADQIILVADAGNKYYADLVFTAPAAGLYSIASTFRGDQSGIGVVVGVIAGGKVLFSSKVSSEGQTVPYNAKVYLTSGEQLVFSAGPNGGDQNTGLTLTITTVPCSLADTLSYSTTKSQLTAEFTLSTDTSVRWTAWLTSNQYLPIEEKFSVTQAATPPKTFTYEYPVTKQGTVGVLSTLTTPTDGIVCSTFSTVDTGTP